MMNKFDDGHESGPIAPVPDSEKISQEPFETSSIPTGLQGMPVDRIVKGIRSIRFAEIAEQA